MSTYLLVKFLHIVGFAYWLGGDLGVFHSSYWVADRTQPPAVRIAAARILFWLDQVPRICMTMMLPLGLHLAWSLNLLPLSPAAMALIWVAGFAWLGNVIYLHLAAASSAKNLLTKVDYWFRLLLSLGLIAIGVLALLTPLIALPYWVSWKLAIFGVLVGCGLLVRVQLAPFGPAFAKLAAGDADDTDNEAIRASLARTRPYVVIIWIGLLASTALGLHLI